MRNKEELRQLQALPLELKIERTKQRIREWVRHYGVDGVYISFSGGKDSTVLLHIVRELYPDIEAVFINTGLEYPEIRKFAMSFPNVKTIYPKKSFLDVMTEYGYPVISKTVSHNVGILRRNPEGRVAKNIFDPQKTGPFACFKWKPLSTMDFMVSDKCCEYTKKEPAHRYSKETGKVSITAQMACESANRESKWLQYGCNAFNVENPISNPMSFWLEQDVLWYIKTRGIKICSVYGDIILDGDDSVQERLPDTDVPKLKTTGCKRTGCMFCGFGAHLEKGENRYQMLAKTHPRQYTYCIGGGGYDSADGIWKPDKNGLGLGHVFDELNKIYGEHFIDYKPLEENKG